MRAFKKGKLIQGASNKSCYQNSEGFFKSPLDGTLTNGTIIPAIFFWSFHTKTTQDQTLPSDVHDKIWPHSTQFWL